MRPGRRLYFNLIAPLYALLRRPSAAESALVDRLLAVPEQAEILDLGSGAGHQARALLRRHAKLRVTEVEPAVLFRVLSRLFLAGEARSLRLRSTRLAAAAERLPLPDHAFDGAVCLFVLWAVEERGRVLAELSRVLKPGAALVLGEFASGAESPGGARAQAPRLPFGHPPLTHAAELRAMVAPYFTVDEVVRRPRALYARCLPATPDRP